MLVLVPLARAPARVLAQGRVPPERVPVLAGRRVPGLVLVPRVPVLAGRRVPGPVRVPQVPAQRVPVRAQASELRVLAQALEPAVRWALEPAVRWALEPVQVRKEPHLARPGNRRPLSGSRRYRY